MITSWPRWTGGPSSSCTRWSRAGSRSRGTPRSSSAERWLPGQPTSHTLPTRPDDLARRCTDARGGLASPRSTPRRSFPSFALIALALGAGAILLLPRPEEGPPVQPAITEVPTLYEDVLTVWVAPATPYSLDGADGPFGFDVDVATEVARRVGLAAGTVDSLLVEESDAIAAVRTRTSLRVVETVPTGAGLGIAVDPRNGTLLDAVNEALLAMAADGTYDRIYDRYEAALPPGGRITAS